MFFDPPTFVLIHVCISVAAAFAGFVALGGLVAGVRLNRWIAWFLILTALTTLTGFGFPFTKLLPSHMVGALSVPVLLGAAAALYWKHLEGGWRTVFVVLSAFALYLNVFVLFAQLFAKVPGMAMLAPTPAAPAFGIVQLGALIVVVGLARASLRALRAA